MVMATKLCKMITCLDKLLTIESHDLNVKYFTFPLALDQWPPNMAKW